MMFGDTWHADQRPSHKPSLPDFKASLRRRFGAAIASPAESCRYCFRDADLTSKRQNLARPACPADSTWKP